MAPMACHDSHCFHKERQPHPCGSLSVSVTRFNGVQWFRGGLVCEDYLVDIVDRDGAARGSHFIIVMIRWTGLAPWEFEFHFPGSLTSTFLGWGHLVDIGDRDGAARGGHQRLEMLACECETVCVCV